MATIGSVSPSPEYLAEDIGDRLLNTTYAFIVLITVVYGLFVVSRLFFTERNGWEIWTLYPISYIFCLTLCISCILMQKLADGGRHVLYILGTDPNKLGTWLKIQTADEAIYMTSVTLPKVAILIMFLHIFVERRVRLLTKIVMAVVILHWFSALVVMFTICQPFSFKWDKSIDGRCSNLMAAYRYISIPNILTDLGILILPLSTLWHLNMSRTRKIGVFLTFLAGGLGIVTAIMRFIGFYETDIESDITYLGVYTMIYTEAEACAYFICSCLPGTRPLLRTAYHRSGLSSALSSYYTKEASSSRKYIYEAGMPMGHLNPKSHHTAQVSAEPKTSKASSYEADGAGFIRLEESFDISHSQDRSARRAGAVV